MLPAATAIAQQDVVTVGSVTATPGIAVDVPVYVRDVSGTPLGIDQPPGSRIQSFSIRVTYSPAAAVQSITFTRAGITAPLTPTFQTSPAAPGSVSLLATFDEATNLIPFVSNAAAPGNQIARLTITLAPTAIPGSTVTLTLDPVLTQLTDAGGSPGTLETVGNGRLTLVNGTVTVSAFVPALHPSVLVLLALSLGFIAVVMRH